MFKAMTHTIKRVDASAELVELDAELAAEVSSVFKYHVPLDTIKQRGASDHLLSTLKSLSIYPFEKEGVEKYKLRKANRQSTSTRRAYWHKARLGDYNLPVPQFALHTALLIKKAEPDCNVSIEYLDTIPTDPFMVIELHGATEYVEFWEEAEFTGKRIF